jgi:hypothetical protein
MKLILEASRIPDGMKVTKATGSKEFTLHHGDVKVYDDREVGSSFIVVCDGCTSLVGDSGISIIRDDLELAVHFKSADDLSNFVYEHLISHK